MSITISSYNSGSDLSLLVQKYSSLNDTRFIVPSRKDRAYHPSLSFAWTWQEIYEDICRSGGITGKKILSPPDHLLILKSILSQVFNEYPEKISAWPGLTRSGFPAVLSDDIRELLNEAIPPGKLTASPESDNPSEFLLPEVYSRYLGYLASNDLLDSAQIWTAAYDALLGFQDWGKNLTVIFTGFLSFNHGQLQLVQALADRCRELVILKPETNLPDFHDASRQFSISSSSEISSGIIIELPVAEPDFEAEVTARNLALWSQGQGEFAIEFTGFDKIGMMISQGREDMFAQAFRRYGVPYDFIDGITISLTLPGKILGSIRNLITRNFPPYDTAMMMTQPCFSGPAFPVMRAYRAGYTGLDSWEEYLASQDDETSHTALLAVRAIRKFTGILSRLNTPAGIMRAFHEFLTTPGLWLDRLNKTADFPEFDESIRLTASAIQTVGDKVLALDELLPDIGPVQNSRLTGDEAYDFLDSWCRNSFTRAPVQVSDSVRIFTGQPPVLAFFPVWIMTGVTQKTWSGNVTASPLLGTEERRKLALNEAYLPLPSDKAAQREALFRRLIQAGEKVTAISRPELDEEGRPVSESPFMSRFAEDMKGWKVIRSKSAGIKIFAGSDDFVFPEIDAQGSILREVPVLRGRAGSAGASDIHELLSCPFLWWQKRRAGLYEPSQEIASPVEWGIMLHKYWANVWRRYREDMTASGKIFVHIAGEEWERLLRAGDEGDYSQFRRLIHDFRLGRRRESIKYRVDRLAMLQAGILDNLHEAGCEHKEILLEEEAHLKAGIDGVTFLGQCDRIEILTDPEGYNLAFIADYKEGTSSKYEEAMKNIQGCFWNTEQKDKFAHGLQLSVYASLFSRGDCELAGVYILGLEDGKISGTFAGKTVGFFKDYKAKISSDLQARIDEGDYAMKCSALILNGEKFMPDYNSDSCNYCKIKSLCRKGEFRGEAMPDE